MKFSEQHKKVPEKLLTISPPELAVTVTTNPVFAQALFNIWTEALLKHLTPKLETVTQYKKEQKQEVYNPGSSLTSILPLGAEAINFEAQCQDYNREELP